MQFPFGESMTVLRAARVVDPFSGESGTELDWDSVAETPVPGLCAIYPSIITESNELGDIGTPMLIMSNLTAIVPYGTDIGELDMLRVDTGPYARTYDVKAVKPWRLPFTGWAPGTEVRLWLGNVDG